MDPFQTPAHDPSRAAARNTVDHAEIAKFEAMAEGWWDPTGKFRPLHRLNPVRVRFIRDRLAQSLGRDPNGPEPLRGLSILDVGCGGGLLAEPLARLGATVTGIDAAERNIAIARDHAEKVGVKVTYLPCTAEDLAAQGAQFDAVLAMEIVEHVADLDGFIGACADLLKPTGTLFVATLNRTVKSFAMAIVGAEYVLRWLPRGTHDWKRFLRPSELAQRLRARGLALRELAGVTYHPLDDSFALGRDCSVNYLAVAGRPRPR
ncbi:MAG TPA: bifunctional 2-polyprenyl-6-hydroxyphenol methylase/3-demethylubiquinol 3-O-methyltransferase UbiG [Dongiaceae bacterium]|jgi:2-polyprenyl-6-hydroxyphenyl methylase/3-demethylubiquinone-9 3-methyltransferase|nr:bifunctional 2-polyprenyl-6-hydroxyphenol methylase/3-demethylubiquinol 3-O-methyltransferase UbiG [Dongiaceae bacterium]